MPIKGLLDKKQVSNGSGNGFCGVEQEAIPAPMVTKFCDTSEVTAVFTGNGHVYIDFLVQDCSTCISIKDPAVLF